MPRHNTKATIANRDKTYGPMKPIGNATGRAIRAVLEAHFQQPLPGEIPAHIVSLIMVQVKVMRAAVPHAPNRDNYHDLHGYAEMAEQLDPRYARRRMD